MYDNNVNTVCNLCNENVKCDEVHLLFQCDFFSQERLELMGKNKYRFINTNLVYSILNSKSTNKLFKLSKFMNIILSVFVK